MARYLAIDWDPTQLHIIAADVQGGAVIFRRAIVWPEAATPNLANAEELGRHLKDRLKEAGIAPAPVLVCVGRDRVVLKDVRHPTVPDADEPAVVRFQAVKELTDAPDDVVLDYAPLGGSSASGERRALVVTVRKELLAAYQKLCLAAGLKLAGMTPRPFGLAAAVPAPPDAPAAVVAQGDGWAEFCIVRQGVPLLARTLSTTPANLPGEVRRNLTVFAGHAPNQAVQSLFIAAAADGPVHQRLGEAINLPTHAFDPFGGATGIGLPPGERGSFAGAAGLLLARARAQGLAVNFVQPRQPKAPPRYNIARIAAVAALVLVPLIGVTAYCNSLLAAQTSDNARLEEQRDDLDSELKNFREANRRLLALDAWEAPVWLDQIYDLAAQIGDPDALKLSFLSAEPLPRTGPKARYAAKLKLKGTLRDGSRQPLDQLVAQLAKDGHYGPEAPRVNGNQFELIVNVERRAPQDFTLTLHEDGKR